MVSSDSFFGRSVGAIAIALILAGPARAEGSTDPATTAPAPEAVDLKPPAAMTPDAPTLSPGALQSPVDEPTPTWIPVTLTAATWVIASIGVVQLGTRAWWDQGWGAFHFLDSGFYGLDTYAGGADKQGHMTCSYIATHLFASIEEAFGFSRPTAGWLSAAFTFFLFNGFEFLDAFTQYGFEYGDSIFNSIGIGLALLGRLYPQFDSIFGLRLGWFPSNSFLNDKPIKMWKFINDYTGTLFFMDFKGRGVMEALGKDPGALRWLVGGFVFATQGFDPANWPMTDRRQLLGVHVGLSLPEVLRATGVKNVGMRLAEGFLDMFALPALNVMVMRDLNRNEWVLSLGVGDRAQAAF